MTRLTVCFVSALMLVICCQPVVAQAAEQNSSTKRDKLAAIHKDAENGDATAQCQLAFSYSIGVKGAPPNYRQAAYWYRKAADQGDATAEQELGELYYNGQGVPQDYAQAVYWVRKAANQGDTAAEWDLGGISKR